MKSGTVKEYDRDRGFGFVTGDDGEDYFLHVSGLRAVSYTHLTLPTNREV